MRAPGRELSETQVLEFCTRAGFASYEMPRHVLFVDAIPKGDTGKIQRRVMTERATTALGL